MPRRRDDSRLAALRAEIEAMGTREIVGWLATAPERTGLAGQAHAEMTAASVAILKRRLGAVAARHLEAAVARHRRDESMPPNDADFDRLEPRASPSHAMPSAAIAAFEVDAPPPAPMPAPRPTRPGDPEPSDPGRPGDGTGPTPPPGDGTPPPNSPSIPGGPGDPASIVADAR